MVPFSLTFNDPDPDFKSTLLFDVEYLRNVPDRHMVTTDHCNRK